MEKRKAEVPEGAECPQRGGLDSRRLDAIWVVGVEKWRTRISENRSLLEENLKSKRENPFGAVEFRQRSWSKDLQSRRRFELKLTAYLIPAATRRSEADPIKRIKRLGLFQPE